MIVIRRANDLVSSLGMIWMSNLNCKCEDGNRNLGYDQKLGTLNSLSVLSHALYNIHILCVL